MDGESNGKPLLELVIWGYHHFLETPIYLGWWQLKYVLVFLSQTWGRFSFWLFFQMGWNHQLLYSNRYPGILKFWSLTIYIYIYTHRCDHPTHRFMLMFWDKAHLDVGPVTWCFLYSIALIMYGIFTYMLHVAYLMVWVNITMHICTNPMDDCFDSQNLSRDHYLSFVTCASLVDCLFQKLPQTAQL